MSADTSPVRILPGTDPASPHADPVADPRDRPEAGRPASLAAAVELPPLLVDADAAARLLGVSIATWYRMASAGRTPAPVRLTRGCVRYRYAELVEWCAA